jgi:hypothetical protein
VERSRRRRTVRRGDADRGHVERAACDGTIVYMNVVDCDGAPLTIVICVDCPT